MPQQLPSSSLRNMPKRGRRARVRVPAGRAWLLCFWAATLLLAGAAQACDTPVYQYTIQMWQRDPYYAYYFYSAAEQTDDGPVNRYLERVARGTEGHVNLAFTRVDVKNLDSSEYTDEHRRVWARHQSSPLPLYVILTARGTELFVGQLDSVAAKALIDSPKRREIADQLCQGKQGLLLLLLGSNQPENAAAKMIVREVVAEAADQHQEVGLVELARGDPEEEWLVRQLLQLEDDLPKLDNTMLFPVFGRGHALEPYLGKGISRENLRQLVAFMNGPCSCEVKASSAGMDLLTDWNWDAHLADWSQPQEKPLKSALFDVQEPASGEPVDDMPPLASAIAPQSEGAAGAAVRARPAPAAPAPAPVDGQRPTASAPARSESGLRGEISNTNEQPAAAVSGARSDGEERSPEVADQPRIDEAPSFASVVSVRLAVALGAATLLLVGGSLVFVWKRRER